eukprot:SM007067S21506  [mRNA]  locus=s7067:263:715:- [translate_table: standard]
MREAEEGDPRAEEGLDLSSVRRHCHTLACAAGTQLPARPGLHSGSFGMAALPGLPGCRAGDALVPGPRRGLDVCNNCRRPGHYARECPNAAVCNKCQKAG